MQRQSDRRRELGLIQCSDRIPHVRAERTVRVVSSSAFDCARRRRALCTYAASLSCTSCLSEEKERKAETTEAKDDFAKVSWSAIMALHETCNLIGYNSFAPGVLSVGGVDCDALVAHNEAQRLDFCGGKHALLKSQFVVALVAF